jgi:arylsulfatase A-like enzyme
VDSLRKDHVGAYGNDWIRTPSLDALAEESLRFTRAYPESIPSIPARRAIHTGTRTWPFRGGDLANVNEDDLGLWGWEPIPEDQTTLAEVLQERGYGTMLVTDTLHQFRPSYNMHRGFGVYEFVRGQERDFYRPRSPASDEKIEGALIGGPGPGQGEDIMLQYYANTMGRGREEDWFAARVFSKGMRYLEAAKEAPGPFFLAVDCYDPHEPWDPPEEYVRMYSSGHEGPEPVTSSSGPSDWLTEAQLERMRARYAGEVTMVDRWLGRFLEKMDELGLSGDTLLVLLSDHGHAFGEHGYAGKVPGALYPELTDIVFMVRHPQGKMAGKTSDYFASTHDVAPTVLGFLGVSGAGPHGAMDGRDLSVLFEGGEPEARPHFTLGYHDHVFARDERWAMFANNDGSEAHLFDLSEDPEMDKNVAPADPELAGRMFRDYVLEDAGGRPLPA